MANPTVKELEQRLSDAVMRQKVAQLQVDDAGREIVLVSGYIQVAKEYEAELESLKAEIKVLKKV